MHIKKKRKSQPWADQKKKGRIFLFFCIIFFTVAIISTIFSFSRFGSFAALAGIFSLSKSINFYEDAHIRKFGKTFELENIGLACNHLTANGIECHNNIMINGLGDIDLLVKVNKKLIPVEIKSFRYWNSQAFSMGKREKNTVAQVKRQIRVLHNYGHSVERGIIWLPQGRPNFIQRFLGVRYGTIMVIFGNKKQLLKRINNLAS